MQWRRNSTLRQNHKTNKMYSQIENALNNFVENMKITGNSHDDDGYTSSNRKTYSYSKQYAIFQKAKELLELLKDEYGKSRQELNDSKDVASQDAYIYGCSDMSLTLANAEYLLDNTDDPDATKYLSDMEITCLESSSFKTPKTTVRSILKSGQTQRSESARRRVRFEDELEETLAEIIENKENLNWEPIVAEESCSLAASVKSKSSGCPSGAIRSIRSVSRGKTIDTLKILSQNDQPRKSWASSRGSVDLKALRDIKTMVEIENERRQRNSKKHNNDDSNASLICGDDSIKTPASVRRFSPIMEGLRLSCIPDDLDILGFRLSWTPKHELELDSSISFQ